MDAEPKNILISGDIPLDPVPVPVGRIFKFSRAGLSNGQRSFTHKILKIEKKKGGYLKGVSKLISPDFSELSMIIIILSKSKRFSN